MRPTLEGWLPGKSERTAGAAAVGQTAVYVHMRNHRYGDRPLERSVLSFVLTSVATADGSD